MRGLFYRHRRWQKLNVFMFSVSVLTALFFHGVINTLAVIDGTPAIERVHALITQGHIAQVFLDSSFFAAQFDGFLAIISHPGLWFDWLWLPVSIALILVIQGFGTLLNRPRWQRSVLLLFAAWLGVWGLPQVFSIEATAAELSPTVLVGLYFSIAACLTTGARLRGHHSH